MTITIRLTKVEYEMLKELQKRDKRYKKGLEEKIKGISICSLGKEIRPLFKSLIPYPINSDDPGQEHWIT